MTKEEAIKVLKSVREYTSPKEAFDMAIDALSESALSEGLEEAALLAASEYPSDEYPKVIDPEGGEHEMYDFTALMDMFKAGAKWEAEQGESFVSNVLVNGMNESYVDGYYLNEKLPEGTDVIVQIRRKI